MAENTKIEWAHHTFNSWEGCQKVGPGCDNCYAEARNARFAGGQAVNWGPGAPRRRTSVSNWRLPLKWNEQAQVAGIRSRVFCASLADVFDNEVDPQWRADLFYLISETPNLDWLLLTKRIGNVATMLNETMATLAEQYPEQLFEPWLQRAWSNVWIGATIVNQAEADRDIPKLLAVPARVRFLSMEPLLGPVDLARVRSRISASRSGITKAVCYPGGEPWVDWIIVGGESGRGARPMHPDWARSLRDQCQAAGVPLLFKQHGEWIGVSDLRNLPGGAGPGFGAFDHCAYDQQHEAVRVGKKAAGRLLEGRTWDEVPS